MAESEVVKVAREYREALARNEDAALREMARQWARLEAELRGRMELVVHDIEDLQAAGEAVPPQLIYNRRRYQEMIAQIQQEIPDYQRNAEDVIKKYQQIDYNLGLDGANAVLKASRPSSGMWSRIGKDAVETVVGFAGNGAPLSTLLTTDYGALSQGILDALVSGVALGKGARATASDMADACASLTYKRATRIARTEINRTYRAANAAQYQKSRVVKKVLRLCYKPTACAACLAMDGEECPNGMVDDHPNGKCTSVVVTTGGNAPEWEHGSEWFDKLPDEDKRRILGEERFELYKAGMPLRSMVEMRENPVWGGSPSVVSVKELQTRYNITADRKFSLPTPTKNDNGEVLQFGSERVVKTERTIPMPSGWGNKVLPDRDCEVYTTSDGHEFIFPKVYDIADQGMTPETAIKGWYELPENIRSHGQKQIYFVDYYNQADEYWQKTYKNFKHSYATGGEEITFYKNAYHNYDYYKESLAHEIGHWIDYGGRISDSEEWINAMRKDTDNWGWKSPTDYGENSRLEDFAESIKEFWENPEMMELYFPERLKIIKGLLGEA